MMLDVKEGTGYGHGEVVRGSFALRHRRTSRRGQPAWATGKVDSLPSVAAADCDIAGGDGRHHDATSDERGGIKSLHLE